MEDGGKGLTPMTFLFRFFAKHLYMPLFLLGGILVIVPLVYERVITTEYLRQERMRTEFGRPRAWTEAESIMGMWWCLIRDPQFPYQRNFCVGAGVVLMTVALSVATRDFWRRRTVSTSATLWGR